MGYDKISQINYMGLKKASKTSTIINATGNCINNRIKKAINLSIMR